MTPSKRIVVNTAAQYTRTIINVVLSLYSTRLILAALGQADFGIFSLVGGVISMLSFITNALAHGFIGGVLMLLLAAIYHPELHFPTFLYGEEIFFAELNRAAQLIVKYTPTLRISNIGNVSTGKVNQKQRAAWSKETLNVIQKQFFME